MAATVIDGEAVARAVRAEVRSGFDRLSSHGIRPGLAVLLIGNDPASLSYVRGKTRDAEELGIYSETIRRPEDFAPEAAFGLLADLNADPRFHGILVQQPLPPHYDTDAIVRAVSPEKDVDGLHPLNAGLLLHGDPGFIPCTPAGIQELLLRSGYDPAGKRVVILGRSNLVGKPLAALLLHKAKGGNATVTVCHTLTRDLPEITRQAEILVAVIGVGRFVTAEMVSEGTVVIDVGVNRLEDPSRKRGFRLVGDVDYDQVAPKAAAITPVPGGVGPMTRAMLLVNTLKAAEKALARSAPGRATDPGPGAGDARND
ncbi:MAG: bifunctional 5,10-methylenetetrahydrofolate dehydrogenase/5,10-methenyltetrahydrofolate cyclohydrolase [Dehalococcoidia bacterium]